MNPTSLAYQELPEANPDQRIAEAVVAGNHQAYNQLIERYWGRIFARVYQLLNNHEDAEEVTQDAFSKAFESLPRFRWEASFSTWLYQIASNLARNRYWYWKRRGRGRGISMDMSITEDGLQLRDILPNNEADPGDRLRWNEFQDTIETHMERLPEQHREIMEMRLLEDLSYEDISSELEIPVGTVKSRIARARQNLCRGMGIGADDRVGAYAMELSRGRS